MKIDFETFSDISEGRRINRLTLEHCGKKYKVNLPDNMYYWQVSKEDMPRIMFELILPAVNRLLEAYESESPEGIKSKRAQVVRDYFDRRKYNEGISFKVKPPFPVPEM